MKRYQEIDKKDIITQCPYCGSIKQKDGSWDNVKRKIIRNEPYSHGPCPKCFKREMDKIKNM